MPRTILACALVAASVLLSARLAVAQPLTGSVRGAEAINVRRGPSPDTAAFAVLSRGASVVVEAREGQWARVVLGDGERGWVNVAFLDVPPGVPVAPAAVAQATAGGEAAAPSPTGSASPSLDDELARLRERLASLESAVVPTPSATPRAAAVEPAAAAAQMQGLPTGAVVAPSDTLDVGPALALAGVCFVVGFLLGTFYGQRQERRGRSRVRF